MKLRSLLFAIVALVTIPVANSQAFVSISVGFAPPVLPIYAQPVCPTPGYIWTPGYWAWSGFGGYYWVPGVWVAPPSVGLYWTPPYWGWGNGVYVFHQGYWGPHIGFYGGINYGYGYFGSGYYGGRWAGNRFLYNTAVTRVNRNVIRNVYVDRSVVNRQVNRERVSFNGPGGVKAVPTAEQRAAETQRRAAATQAQIARQEAASKNPGLQAKVNGGHPKPEAVRAVQNANAETAKANTARPEAAERTATNRNNNANQTRAEEARAKETRAEQSRAGEARAASVRRAEQTSRAAELRRERSARNAEVTREQASRNAQMRARDLRERELARRDMTARSGRPETVAPRPQNAPARGDSRPQSQEQQKKKSKKRNQDDGR
ncbi:MAG: hypothetical protein DLM52_07015 [Chthoniobacterales bacterium]|nr:MAG: hypothetical protein DLM52_07015 [Chthoniobacterales bacterium]